VNRRVGFAWAIGLLLTGRERDWSKIDLEVVGNFLEAKKGLCITVGLVKALLTASFLHFLAVSRGFHYSGWTRAYLTIKSMESVYDQFVFGPTKKEL
jgi:hypothetical protein